MALVVVYIQKWRQPQISQECKCNIPNPKESQIRKTISKSIWYVLVGGECQHLHVYEFVVFPDTSVTLSNLLTIVVTTFGLIKFKVSNLLMEPEIRVLGCKTKNQKQNSE